MIASNILPLKRIQQTIKSSAPTIELATINRLPSSPRTMGKISSLDHEVWDNSVELGPLVVERLAVYFADALLASAQGTEVLSGFRDCLTEKSHQQSPNWCSCR